MPQVEELTARLRLDVSEFKAELASAGTTLQTTGQKVNTFAHQVLVSASAMAVLGAGSKVGVMAYERFAGSAGAATAASKAMAIASVPAAAGLTSMGTAAGAAGAAAFRAMPALLGLAVPIVGVGVAAIGTIKLLGRLDEAIAAGANEMMAREAATFRLRALFDETTDSLSRLRGSMLDVAKTPFFDQSQIAASQAILANSGATARQIETFIPVLADMAAVMGMDLVGASDRLAMALIGSTRGLKDFGIYIKAGSTQAEILAAVQAKAAQFHGMAAEKVDTLEGKMRAYNKTMLDASTHMASIFSPLLKVNAELMLGMANAANTLAEALDNAFKSRPILDLPQWNTGPQAGGAKMFAVPDNSPYEAAISGGTVPKLGGAFAGFENLRVEKDKTLSGMPVPEGTTAKQVEAAMAFRLAMSDAVKEGSAEIDARIKIINETLGITKTILSPERRKELENTIKLLKVAAGQARTQEATTAAATRSSGLMESLQQQLRLNDIFKGGSAGAIEKTEAALGRGGFTKEDEAKLRKSIETYKAQQIQAGKEVADAAYEARAEAARRSFAEQQSMDDQIRDADLEDLLDRSREERKIGEMRLRFAEQAADTLINAADIALSGEGVTTKNIASMGKSFGQEAGDAIKESAKEYGDAAGQQLGAAIKMASAWFAFILTHPPEKPEDTKKLAAALKEKQGGVLISGMKLTDEEKARALGNVGGKMVGAGGQGMSPAAEKAAQAQIAKDRKIAEDQKKFDDAVLARQAAQQGLDDRLRGESKLKAAQTRLGMAQGTITKSAGNLQLGLMGIEEGERGELAGIASREAGQTIGILDANQATPLNAAQRAGVGEMYSKNVTRAAEAVRSGADTKGLATQLGLSEEVLQEIKTLVATGKTNAEILKKQAEDDAKRGTEQQPLVILPSSRGNVAILDANALMRQRTAGAGRAFPTGGNARRA